MDDHFTRLKGLLHIGRVGTIRSTMVTTGPVATPEQFTPFDLSHWSAIGAVVVVSLVLSGMLRATAGTPAGQVVRRGVCWGMAALMLGAFVVTQAQLIWSDTWTAAENLPLHLCDIAVFLVAGTLIAAGRRSHADRRWRFGLRRQTWPAFRRQPGWRWQFLYELAYFWGIGGTSQAIVTPDVVGVFPDASWLRYFVLHDSILIGVLVLTVGLRMRPQPGALWRCWVVTLALAVLVLVINAGLRAAGIDANYMYLCGPPANPTLYDLFGRWPWALLSLVVVGTFLLAVCYAPFGVLDWVNRRAAARGR